MLAECLNCHHVGDIDDFDTLGCESDILICPECRKEVETIEPQPTLFDEVPE